MPTDLELLEAWRADDRDAGSELFDRYFPSLLRFFSSAGADDVEDLVQRTMLACVEVKNRVAVQSSFRAYLFGIARNELYDDIRRRRRLPDPLNSAVQSLADLGVRVSAMVAARGEQRWLLEALGNIPIDDQIALALYYWEELSAAEVGEILGLAEPAVRSRLRRAKERLRQTLHERATTNKSSVAMFDLDAGVRTLGQTLIARPSD